MKRAKGVRGMRRKSRVEIQDMFPEHEHEIVYRQTGATTYSKACLFCGEILDEGVME